MRRLALGLLVSFILAPTVAADWLVLHDGSRVETRGAWQARHSTVVFTTRAGTLASLPIRDIDVRASHQASEASTAGPGPALPVQVVRQPMVVITNDDIGPARRSAPVKPAEPARVPVDQAMEPAVGTLFEEAEAELAEGVSWRRIDEGDFKGIEVQGTLENDGEGMVTDLGVTVSLRGDYDQVIASQEAAVQAKSLLPGSYTRFLARFPGLDLEDGKQARIEVHCRAKRVREKKK